MNGAQRQALIAATLGSVIVALTLLGPSAPAEPPVPPGRLELVGHHDLSSRGMNAGLAVRGQYAYIGSRTDGSHLDSGIMVVDISDPAAPRVVHQVGRPAAANLGESSRELRVWPDQDLLLSLNFECHPAGHVCAGNVLGARPTVRFFDIAGEKAATPELVSTYRLPDNPHEMFLWDDPRRPGRALLYVTTPFVTGAEIDTEQPHLLVTDISGARQGKFRELARWSPTREAQWDEAGLHSLSVSENGNRAYLADLEGGLMVADTSDLAQGRPTPRIRQVTAPEDAVHHASPGVHSAVRLPGRPYTLVTDEVYGRGFGLGPAVGVNTLVGCPWGWARLIRTDDEARPEVVGEYRLEPWNDAGSCSELSPLDRESGVSYSSHNPTTTPNLALITWHSAGLQVVDVSDPSRPRAAATFLPQPLPAVRTEDPMLTQGPAGNVIMWSYPVIQDGLIYVVDIRNGLYVLRYDGPHASEVSCIAFHEGNSNVGDTRRSC